MFEKFSVKKPFTVLVMVVVILILGIVSLVKMPLDLLPEVSLPYLLVITTYPGASPERVESLVCEPMESELGTISGVKNVYSISNENYGIVELEFQDGTDLDSAMVKVSSALDLLQGTLPEECGIPSIMEISTDMLATQYLAIGYEGMDIEELSAFSQEVVVPALERQDGVANVTSLGLVEKTIQVELDKDKVEVLNDKILAKTDDAFADALEQLDAAKKQLEDSEKTLQESKQQLIDSQKELDEGKQELIDGQKELDDSKAELGKKQGELNDAKVQLEEGKKELEEKKDETYSKLAAASQALDQLSAFQAQLTSQQAQLIALQQAQAVVTEQSTNMAGLVSALAYFTAWNGSTDPIDPATDAFLIGSYNSMFSALGLSCESFSTKGEAYYAADSAITNAQQQLTAAQSSYASEITALQVEIQATQMIISQYESQLTAMGVSYTDIEKAKLEAASSIGSAQAQLAAGESSLATAQTQLDSGKDSIKQGQEQIDSGWDQLADGQKQIDEGWNSLSDGQKQIDDGWSDYETAVRSYEKQKAEALKKANADELLSLSTLAGIIYAQNFSMPAGYVDDEKDNSWLIKVGDSYESIDELSDLVLCHIDDIGDIRLSDVANITVIDNSLDSYTRLNGEQSVILSVFKASTAGTNAVSRVCKEEISNLEEQYPGLTIMVMMDQGDYISIIVKSVFQSMLIGAALAILILAIFLRDVKPTTVVALSIPLSVLTALVAMYFSNISLNMMSLSGLALGIGMLVDNSIVVIENIYRLRGRGVSAPRAAVQGTRQVAGAIIASTLTTVCVFLPMIYTTGLVNELMMPMCLSIIYCLLASLVIAVTVVPAAGSTLLRNTKPKEHKFFDRVQELYGKALDFCLRIKAVPIAVAVGLLALSVWLVVRMGIVMIPDMTSNQIQGTMVLSEEMNRDECYKTADQMISKILEIEGVDSVGVMTGDSTALVTSLASANVDFRSYSLMVTTDDPNAGSSEVKRITKEMETAAKALGVDDFTISTGMSEMSSMLGSGLSVSIYGDDLEQLTAISRDVMDLVDSVEGYSDISNGEEDAGQVIHLNIDKNKAMAMGLSVAQIYQELATKLTLSADAVQVTIDGIDMDIKIVDEMEPLTYENLLDYSFTIDVTDEDGDSVTEDHTLGEFAKAEIKDGVAQVDRKNQSRYMTVTAGVEDGYNVTLLTRQLEPLVEAYELPKGYTIDIGGEYETVIKMIQQMALVIALGLAFIYLVMVAQFQSLLSPFIVLFTIPLAFTGGLLALWGTGENLSIISLMGFVVLMGTVVNNGIVFVDYVNQLRLGGLERRDALIVTGKTRMRPILMTALTTILAESNLIFGDDMGSQMGRGMALVIAGGLAYATLMTLFIIPVMYDILFKKQPLLVDLGPENLDDIPDDAQEYLEGKESEANVIEESASAETSTDSFD